MKCANRKKGFTIIELIIVVVLISMIAAFGIPQYNRFMIKSYERNMIISAIALRGAGEIYFAKNGFYPPINFQTAGIASTFNIPLADTDRIHYGYNSAPFLTMVPHYDPGSGPWDFHVCAKIDIPLSATNPCCQPTDTCPTLVSCGSSCY